ncbi:hypothetical protein FHS45_003510 [Thalassobacillus devorans]|nr:hypothetical protein [Thalassobacillus devorans]NIK30386.1 hypothetical protein [Thalassobacillus devorans]
MYEHPENHLMERGFCIFPGYKWCGPGCSGPGAPVNGVDMCCMYHDICYQQYGPSCYCDRAFMECLQTRINPYTLEGRHARTIYNYMKFQQLFTCLLG